MHRLVHSEDTNVRIHGNHLMGRFNAWVATRITKIVGTMWAAYCFAILALISLPAVIASGQPLIIVAWIAQTFLQLVLLPIIIVGQNVNQAVSDARAETDHETLDLLHKINEQQLKILTGLEQNSHIVAAPPPSTRIIRDRKSNAKKV